ncbi:MAG: DUF4838 domain-containing protein [Bryobacterales bacterium]|nr:DUF4838 domain-containing protein [Bryobacterales bacterium]
MLRVFLICLAALPLTALDLVKNGASEYKIWIPVSAIPSEVRAAEELQRYVEAMSGAKLEVVRGERRPKAKLVRLDSREAPRNAGSEGFIIKADGKDLVIAGGRPRGTMYGVYTLLDQLGVRWYTKEVTKVPKLGTVKIAKLDGQLQQPAFEYREPFITEAWDKDWAARNRTNGHFQQLDQSTGGRLRYQPFVHSFYELLPPDKYFAAHPEYYSFIDGKRRVERGQLCLTNPEVKRLGVERVRQWIKENPEAMIFSVSQNDWEGWCECDNCKRAEQEEGGEHSGPILRFVNAIAEEIEKTNPDKLIDTLAYWYTENPPLKVRPRPNVRIRLCPIGVCEAHPYEQCPRSAYFMKNLRAWNKITNQLYIWHYNTNFSHYILPFPDFDELAANIPMYKRNGVVGIFLEGAYAPGGGGELGELRAWVMARQLWDTGTDVDAAVNEFMEGVYGPAAKPMRAYYDLVHEQVRPAPKGKGAHIWIFALPEYSAEFLPKAQALFAEAEQLAKTDDVRQRVLKQRVAVDYLRLLDSKTYQVRGDVYAPADLPGLKDQFQTLVARMREFGIKQIHEHNDLKYDENDYNNLKAHAVVRLENDRLRVEVVPALSGRVVNIIDKSTGKNLLRATDPSERLYPDVGGASATAHADYQARPWQAVWSLESANGSEVKVVGKVENGLAIRRTLGLDGGQLVSETVLENASGKAVDAVLRVTADLNPGDIDQALVKYTSADGKAVERKLIRPEEQPTGNETWWGGQLPAGEWRVESAGWKVANRFDARQIERAAMSFTVKGAHRTSLAVWSKSAKLEPGQTIQVRSSYGVD